MIKTQYFCDNCGKEVEPSSPDFDIDKNIPTFISEDGILLETRGIFVLESGEIHELIFCETCVRKAIRKSSYMGLIRKRKKRKEKISVSDP